MAYIPVSVCFFGPEATMYVPLFGFRITYAVKHCTRCQSINYNNTTSHIRCCNTTDKIDSGCSTTLQVLVGPRSHFIGMISDKQKCVCRLLKLSKEKKISWRDRGWTQNLLLTLFSVVVIVCACRWFRLWDFTAGVRTLFGAHPIWATQFSVLFTSLWLVFFCRFYIDMSGVKWIFFCFVSRVPSNGYFKPIRTRHWHVADTFLFITRTSAPV